jgi:hypothetical protein
MEKINEIKGTFQELRDNETFASYQNYFWNLTRIIVDDMFIYKTLMDDLFAEQEYNPKTKNGDSK